MLELVCVEVCDGCLLVVQVCGFRSSSLTCYGSGCGDCWWIWLSLWFLGGCCLLWFGFVFGGFALLTLFVVWLVGLCGLCIIVDLL